MPAHRAPALPKVSTETRQAQHRLEAQRTELLRGASEGACHITFYARCEGLLHVKEARSRRRRALRSHSCAQEARELGCGVALCDVEAVAQGLQGAVEATRCLQNCTAETG